VYAWKVGLVAGGSRPDLSSAWPQYLHDEAHSGLNETPLTLKTEPTFFPESRAYNWPNPVRSADGFLTHIRYYVASNAKVTVRIFDLAGSLVGELHADAAGGFDNDIPWDVSQIQSGVYFAHVDAQGSGASGSAIIKIAVVK
jgi:hypothetical protein